MNRYKLIKPLQSNARFTVYKAFDAQEQQYVCIKQLHARFKTWEEVLGYPEIEVLQRTNHAGIVQLREILRVGQHSYCIVTELLETSLQEYCEFLQARGKSPDEREIYNIMLQLARVLQHLESKRIVHGDLSAQNVFIYKDSVKLANFDDSFVVTKDGQALPVEGMKRRAGSPQLSPRNVPPGASDNPIYPFYPAPEILLCAQKRHFKSEIFSLACLMVELFAMRPALHRIEELDVKVGPAGNQLRRYMQILGIPTATEWEEGYSYVKKNKRLIVGRQQLFQTQTLQEVMTGASAHTCEVAARMLRYNLVKRLDAKRILEYGLFEQQQQQQQQQMFQEGKQLEGGSVASKQNHRYGRDSNGGVIISRWLRQNIAFQQGANQHRSIDQCAQRSMSSRGSNQCSFDAGDVTLAPQHVSNSKTKSQHPSVNESVEFVQKQKYRRQSLRVKKSAEAAQKLGARSLNASPRGGGGVHSSVSRSLDISQDAIRQDGQTSAEYSQQASQNDRSKQS